MSSCADGGDHRGPICLGEGAMGEHSGSMSLVAAVWHVRRANWGSLTYLLLPGLNGVPRFQEAIPGEAEVQQHAQHVLCLLYTSDAADE